MTTGMQSIVDVPQFDEILTANSIQVALGIEAELLPTDATGLREGDGDVEDQHPVAVPPARLYGGPTVDEVLTRAKSELGYRERPHNENKFGQWYGLDYNPWCAIFVSKVFFDENLPLAASTSKGFASCSIGAAWFKTLGRWSLTPQRGYVVFFDWDGQPPIDHVGIVEHVRADHSLITIEGNTSAPDGGPDGVFQKHRTSGIVGYGVPAYGIPHVYIVRPGDTMSAIAAAHGVSLNALIQANPQIPRPDLIHPGDRVNIPSPARG